MASHSCLHDKADGAKRETGTNYVRRRNGPMSNSLLQLFCISMYWTLLNIGVDKRNKLLDPRFEELASMIMITTYYLLRSNN